MSVGGIEIKPQQMMIDLFAYEKGDNGWFQNSLIRPTISWGGMALLGGSSQDLYCKWLRTHGNNKFPKDRVVGPLPNGLLIHGV